MLYNNFFNVQSYNIFLIHTIFNLIFIFFFQIAYNTKIQQSQLFYTYTSIYTTNSSPSLPQNNTFAKTKKNHIPPYLQHMINIL